MDPQTRCRIFERPNRLHLQCNYLTKQSCLWNASTESSILFSPNMTSVADNMNIISDVNDCHSHHSPFNCSHSFAAAYSIHIRFCHCSIVRVITQTNLQRVFFAWKSQTDDGNNERLWPTAQNSTARSNPVYNAIDRSWSTLKSSHWLSHWMTKSVVHRKAH